MKKNRLVVKVRGGLVIAAYEDFGIDPNTDKEVIILDYDMSGYGSREEWTEEEQQAITDIENKKLKVLYEL